MKPSILVSVDQETNRILQEVQNSIYEGTRGAIEQARSEILSKLEESCSETQIVKDTMVRTLNNSNSEMKNLENSIKNLPQAADMVKYVEKLEVNMTEEAEQTRTDMKNALDDVNRILSSIIDTLRQSMEESRRRYESALTAQNEREQALRAELQATHELLAALNQDMNYLRQPWYKKIF